MPYVQQYYNIKWPFFNGNLEQIPPTCEAESRIQIRVTLIGEEYPTTATRSLYSSDRTEENLPEGYRIDCN